ncbi:MULTISPECIES: hypothetical protein [Halorussus]|uniref:hypothetical protein n=1 Tax=Halorussus TaxID=1070314 RepID=UPI00209F2050|nr:hypothetical protein [Halorussus vallis]USZ78252.1 hypothetical protein NGM07_23235 [Halorussus vallis]
MNDTSDGAPRASKAPSATATGRWRRAAALVLVGLLVAAAGCSGLGGSVRTAPSSSTPDDGAGAETSGIDGTPTATSTATTNGTTTTSDGHGHDHSHGESTDSAGGSNSSDAALEGEMTVVVAGTQLSAEGVGSQSAGFWFGDESGSEYKVWHAAEGERPTLARALSAFGVEATAESLRYGGETYAESDSGVSLNYRVNGEPVKPTEYVLRSGDEVWVTVETPGMNVSVPGDHIHHDNSHVHGTIDFVVNGHEVDFSRDRYQVDSHSRYFHFEGGHADPWHAHSWSVTLKYAMSTLQGINVSDGTVTYNGTTYADDEAGTTVKILVNGEPVDPGEYLLKDGDHVRIAAESDAGS